MTDILWLKFSDDTSLPVELTAIEKEKLESIFDANNPQSLWSLALKQAGLKPINADLVKWVGNTPYMNWTAMTDLITIGWVGLVPDEKQGFQYKLKGRLPNFIGFLKSQWKISQYFMRTINSALPETTEGKITESIALGFALLMLTLRLPTHNEAKLAGWLANPQDLKSSVQRTLVQIIEIQKRRTELSSAWHEYFPSRAGDTTDNLPKFFWNNAPTVETEIVKLSGHSEWKGLPVSGGLITGRAVIAVQDTGEGPFIYIFSQARPETIEYFERAIGIIYAQGGVMSHACTIAREMNINCITAAGGDFLDTVKAEENIQIEMNGATGEIKLIK